MSADRIVETVMSQKNSESGGSEKEPTSKRPSSPPTAFSARLMK